MPGSGRKADRDSSLKAFQQIARECIDDITRGVEDSTLHAIPFCIAADHYGLVADDIRSLARLYYVEYMKSVPIKSRSPSRSQGGGMVRP